MTQIDELEFTPLWPKFHCRGGENPLESPYFGLASLFYGR